MRRCTPRGYFDDDPDGVCVTRGTQAARYIAMPKARFAEWLRDHGLALATGGLFLVFMAAQTMTGYVSHNDDLLEHARPPMSLGRYLVSGHFLEATAENWESEFLQMAGYVLLTVVLYQRGSSESKKIGERDEVDRDPRLSRDKPGVPWPVRRGGWVLRVYENSLSLAFLLLFFTSLTLHAIGGAATHNEEALEHGQPTISLSQFVVSAEFWFQSFQNWQSEFLVLFLMVTLSVYLRQRGSPESKPVDAAHRDTGR
jgi:hypothetical protein